MTEQERNVAFVREGLEAFERGDLEAVLAMLDPEIEVYAPPEVGNPGTYHGPEGFVEWTVGWFEAWEDFTNEPQRIEPVGRRHVVVEVLQRARGRGSGLPLERHAAFMWEGRDGRAVAVHLYPTIEEAIEVARRREGERDE
jgi:ketosteroid isomerase-like protein